MSNLPDQPRPDVRELTRRALAAKIIKDYAASFRDTAAAEAVRAMQETGTLKQEVTDDNGVALGTVTRSKGRVRAVVTDERKLLAWMEKRHPDEVVVVKQIRPATLDKLLREIAKMGAPADPFSDTGEVVPGVEIVEGSPYITCKPTDEARERMQALLSGGDLFQLPAAGGGDSDA